MSQRDRLDRRRDRLFVAFGRLGVRYPVWVAGIVAIFFVVGGVLASRLSITTSRVSLVNEDNWYQQRVVEFHEEFGHHDSPVAIISGGTVEERRAVVDAYVAGLEREEMFRGRVLAQVGAEDIAELLMAQAPGQLAAFRSQLPPDADLAGGLEHGLEGLFALLEAQMLAVLDGEIDPTQIDPKQADAQLAQLAQLAQAFDAKIAADAGAGEGVDSDALLTALVGDQADELYSLEQLRERGLDEEGYFVSNDGERLLLVAFPDFASDQVEDFRPAVERMAAIAETLEQGEIDIMLTGLPFLAVDEQRALAVGMPRSSFAAGFGIFVLLMFAFRSLKRATIALLPIAVGTVVSLGALYLLFGELDMITSTFAAVLMGLGIDFPVHLLARYDEDLRQGRTRREALFSALSKAGPGVVTGALTTALAFLTVSTTEFTSFGQMGVITAIGLVVALLTALLLLPVMLGRGALDVSEAPPREFSVRIISRAAQKAPLMIVLFGVVFAAVGVVVAPSYNPRYLQMLPAGTESGQALNILEADGAMTPWFAWTTADDLEQARRDAETLRSLPSVARVESPTDMLPELGEVEIAQLRADFEGLDRDPNWELLAARDRDPLALAKQVLALVDALDELSFAAQQAGRDTSSIELASAAFSKLRERLKQTDPSQARASLDEIERNMARLVGPAWATARKVASRGHWIPADLPEMFQRRFVAKDGSEKVALYVYPAGDVTSGANDSEAARLFTEELESVDPRTAGQGISLYHHNHMIVQGFERAAFFAFCLVIVLLLLDFGSIRKTLLTLFPVLLGIGWMLGLLAVFGQRLNAATIVVLPLTLGMGIDAGVHMMHRCELNGRSHGGRARIDEVVRGTGGAVVLSSLTTMAGFAGLWLGRHMGMVQLGTAMVIGIGCTLVASVFVLPALLVLLDRAE